MTDIKTNSDKVLTGSYIYIASPLFCKDDHKGLDILESMLDSLGIKYFSPRKDSSLDLRSAKTQEERDAIAQQIFDLNKNAVDNATLVLVNTVGTRWNNAIYSDAGTMVEAGLAIAKHIPVVSYNFFAFGVNIMLAQEVVHHVDYINYEQDGIDAFSHQLKSIMDEIDLRKNDENCSHSKQLWLRTKFFKSISGELV